MGNYRSDKMADRVLAVQQIITNLTNLSSLIKDAENGERGYVLTGDRRYLEPYQESIGKIAPALKSFESQFKSLPSHHHKVNRLTQLVNQKLKDMRETVELRQDLGFEASRSKINVQGVQTTEEIRIAVRDVREDLYASLGDQIRRQREFNRWVFIIFVLGTSATAIVLLSLYHTLMLYIRERDTAQLELQSLNEELEDRIKQRTRELQESNESLQQFAYVASHDLQEPLRTLSSFTQLLEHRYKGKLDADADEFLDFIVNASKRMSSLLNGLLSFVGMKKGVQSTEPICLEKLLADAQLNLQAAIRENDAVIKQGTLPCLSIDPLQVTQLFQNLLSNAIKYRGKAPPEIDINAEKNGSEWIVSVKDNGVGFDQQYADRIFTLFQRLHGREVDGTGLGLSISRKIVESHGGRMWAKSKVGEGSVFYFTLPIRPTKPAKSELAGKV